jgi:prepilin-type N-terminal cleavage/methylation domain-containing protein
LNTEFIYVNTLRVDFTCIFHLTEDIIDDLLFSRWLKSFKVFFMSIRQNHGFTMIEIVVVLVVLFILSTLVVSRYAAPNANQLMAETDGLKANLRYAQIKAMSDALQPNGNPRWEFEITNATSYALYRRGDDGVRVSVNLPSEVPPSATHNLPTGVTLTSGVGILITFDDWGSPGPSNISIGLAQGTQSSNVSITRNTGFIP